MSSQVVSPIEVVRGFRNLRTLVVGDIMLDTYLEGTATRLCSEGPIPVVAKTAEYRLPGGAANTAANLRALGADVTLLGAIGRDPTGSLLRSALHDYSVSDEWLLEDAAVATQHKLRILADGQYVVRFDEGGTRESRPALSHEGQQRLLKSFTALYSQCDLLIVSDYGYGVISEQFIERLRLLQNAEPKILLIDSKALDLFREVRATLVTPNEKEARELVERMHGPIHVPDAALDRGHSAVEQIGRSMLSLLYSEYVAITLGKQGVCLFERNEATRHIPAHTVARANDVGAGDSFTAAMALALAAGGNIEEAARIGIDAAGIVVARQRTAVARYQELLQRVSVREYARRSAHSADATDDMQEASYLLAVKLHKEQGSGKKVVLANGIFDTLHAGHVQFLRQAKALGDILVVGINSDASAQRLKGKGRPVNSARDRVALVSALDMVDEVVLFDEDTPAQLIRLLRPTIHVKGGDYVDEMLPEAEAVQEVGGTIVILPLAGSSTLVTTMSALEQDRQGTALPASKQQDAAAYTIDDHPHRGTL
jgi:D-beta-D-heptose 7-phosphate kinase / D-beta-D-heptose 1-phosphate adenosyltransferase